MVSKKTALITGASSGIGREFAKILGNDDYDLILVALGRDGLEVVREQIQAHSKHTHIKIFDLDLSKTENIDSLYAELKADKIHVDVLINNAGFGHLGNFHEEDWRREKGMIDVNVTAVVYLSHLFIPEMVRKGAGKILNVASTAAFQPGPRMAVYYATKAFVLNFSEAVAIELEGSGVTVTALCPGPTATHFQSVAGVHNSRRFRNKVLPSPREVAEYGYRAMKKGKRVAIYGWLNNVLVFSVRFLPRHLLDHISEYIQDNVKRSY